MKQEWRRRECSVNSGLGSLPSSPDGDSCEKRREKAKNKEKRARCARARAASAHHL